MKLWPVKGVVVSHIYTIASNQVISYIFSINVIILCSRIGSSSSSNSTSSSSSCSNSSSSGVGHGLGASIAAAPPRVSSLQLANYRATNYDAIYAPEVVYPKK